MSELKDTIESALRDGKIITISMDGNETFYAGPQNASIIEGNGCEFLKISHDSEAKLFNLRNAHTITLP